MKVDNELDAAIKKLGKATIPKAYHEEFDEQVSAARARVAASQA